MTLRSRAVADLLTLGVVAAVPATAQGTPLEITELRARVTAIRADLPNITAAADYVADVFTRNPASRFLFSGSRSPALRAEFEWHTGASPEMRDADDPDANGVVVYPVAAWETAGLAAAMMLEQWQAAGRPVIVIGSTAGKPSFTPIRWLLNNGAPDESRRSAPINDIANLVVAWVLYEEFVAAATRQHWQPGIYVSHLVPFADDSNYHLQFRSPVAASAVSPIAAGELGRQFLDRIDSLLTLTARPKHLALVQRAADSLRTLRAARHPIFAGSCANYLSAYIQADSLTSPFRPWNGREQDVGRALQQRGANGGDGALWFGYAGYDCPHVQPSQPIRDAGLRAVVVADDLNPPVPAGLMATVPLSTTFPERVGTVAFNAEGVGSVMSVEALLHYLWIRRLVGAP